MTEYTVRPPRPGDGGGVAAAWRDSADYYLEIAPESFQYPRGEGLDAWLETKLLTGGEDRLALVADHAGAAIGFVSATFLRPHEEADRQVTRDVTLPRVFVNALAVRRDHWHGGAGTELMTAVEHWTRGKGGRLITLEAYGASPVSVPFYEHRMGYHRQNIVFAKSLD